MGVVTVNKITYRDSMDSTCAFDNVCYKELKNEDPFPSYSINCVTTGPLPSYIRTVSPKYETASDQQTEPTNGTYRGCSYKYIWLYCLLLATFIITSSVAVYIVVSQSETENTDVQNKLNTSSDRYKPFKVTINSTDPGYKVYSNNGRTPCAKRCIPYAHPRFRSRCLEGYCMCGGQNYQRTTCLPKVDGCMIKKQTVDTFLDNQPVSGYTCHVTEPTNAHVISVYGNHFSRQTVVNLSGSDNEDAILVLASHYAVKWKLKCTDINLKQIVLVSDRPHVTSGLEMNCNQNSLELPVISSVRVPFGYGDDRYGMDTVNMLKVIRNTFGGVKSFTGAQFADYINVKT